MPFQRRGVTAVVAAEHVDSSTKRTRGGPPTNARVDNMSAFLAVAASPPLLRLLCAHECLLLLLLLLLRCGGGWAPARCVHVPCAWRAHHPDRSLRLINCLSGRRTKIGERLFTQLCPAPHQPPCSGQPAQPACGTARARFTSRTEIGVHLKPPDCLYACSRHCVPRQPPFNRPAVHSNSRNIIALCCASDTAQLYLSDQL